MQTFEVYGVLSGISHSIMFYFEDREDAEHVLQNTTASMGCEIVPITVIKGARVQPCGHPLSAIEGTEPSFYCSMCEKEGGHHEM